MRLKHKAAIVMGSSKGIGAAIVKALAGGGAGVVVNYLHINSAGFMKGTLPIGGCRFIASGRALDRSVFLARDAAPV